MSIIPTLGRLRQEDNEFEVSLGYTVRLFQHKTNNSLSKTPKPTKEKY
jgi:hypothetical protein